jgi:CubicO group peptidase (beta-lactamase class C family)
VHSNSLLCHLAGQLPDVLYKQNIDRKALKPSNTNYMGRNYKTIKFTIFLLMMAMILPSCQVGRFVFYNFADINDHKKFPSRVLTAGSVSYPFQNTHSGKSPKEINGIPFEKYLEDNKTVAFLIIQKDTILYEKYFKGYNKESMVPSFSMAKAVTSILIGCAIDDGLIKSINEPITAYIPELTKNGFDKVTIKHLLQMTSGIRFNESYVNPFGDAASFYYGINLRKAIKKMKLKSEPGKTFDYVSGNTQLLGLVLERSLQGKKITTYLQEKLWTPLGMEYDASWSTDRKKDGLEKTFCCLNARARDFAKIGRLYKNKGNWNGNQIVSKQWVEESTRLDTSEGSVGFYQYQWWLPTPGEDFMAEGILGQFVYVHPSKDLIIVRLGKKEGKADWWKIFTALAKAY